MSFFLLPCKFSPSIFKTALLLGEGYTVESEFVQSNKQNYGLVLANSSKLVKYSPKVWETITKEFSSIFSLIQTEEGSELPNCLINFGPQKREQWLMFLSKAQFLLGLGKPRDGFFSECFSKTFFNIFFKTLPGKDAIPILGLRMGVPYINPIFGENYQVEEEYKKKNLSNPDHFEWFHFRRTQHRFLERFGPPFVYNVDVENKTELERTLKLIKENPLKSPFIPEGFSREEYFRRFHSNVESLVSKDI